MPDDTDNVSNSGADMMSPSSNVTASDGIGSRTQSYASVASSQGSRASRLPDYDFGDDDRPGKYSGPKKKDKKEQKDKSAKKSVKDTKKDTKAKKAETSKEKAKQKKEKDTKTKETKETKTKKAKEPKEKKESKDKKSKKKETESKKSKKDEKSKKDSKSGKKNDAFQEEIQSVVEAYTTGDESPDEDEMTDIALARESEGTASRESSIGRGRSPAKKKKVTKKKTNKRKASRGRSKSKNTKKKKKERSRSKASSDGSACDVSEIGSSTDVTIDDEKELAPKKGKQPQKKGKGSKGTKKKGGPVVITVNDDEDDDVPKEKRRYVCGFIPLPSKREPMLYNCCFCCSLGAGSLLTGIMYALYSVGYIVVRAGEMKRRNAMGIWTGNNLIPDVWRLVLVFGMLTAVLCMLSSVLLIVASCLWGYKEHYTRIQKCVWIWMACTLCAVLTNVGEAVYIVTMPDIIIKDWVHSSDNIKLIKENIPTFTAMAAPHALLYLYLSVVLISYIRLLKYLDSPKIGRSSTPSTPNDPKAGATTTPAKKTPVKRPRSKSISVAISEPDLHNVEDGEDFPIPAKRNLLPEDELPPRSVVKENKLKRNHTFNDRIYENTSFNNDDEEEAGPSGTLSRATSELSLGLLSTADDKKESFQDVLDDITNDPSIFDNMSKPKPLKRIPMRKTRPMSRPVEEAIYINQNSFEGTQTLPPDLKNADVKSNYTQVAKPLKKTSSLSDISGPVYDSPAPEVDLDELLKKSLKKTNKESSQYSSKDTGFNSEVGTVSNSGSQPDIKEMERLAEKLRQEQEALDKSGNCDPAAAENLTQMAMNALRLSERILQDVKATEQSKRNPTSRDADRGETEMPVPNIRLAESFFEELARDPNSMTDNPIEEMFRMYGKDLCSQNPEMVDRYLMSYKALQDDRSRQQSNRPSFDISETIANEEKPWRSIMNPSEAVPAMNPVQMQMQGPNPMDPLLSSMSQSSMSSYPQPSEDPRRPQSAFAPIHPQSPAMSQPFHSMSHAQSGPPPPNAFFPLEYPMQNSASYNHEPPGFSGPQSSMVPYKPPPMYESRNAGPSRQWGPQKYPPKGAHPDSTYYDEECPYSCCYTMYDDYGSVYGDYGGYPSNYMGPDPIYGDPRMYHGPNWFPMGDPTYSIDPYYNPYEYWDEPAPPYTEKSSSTYKPRNSSRGYDSKASSSRHGSSSRGYDGKAASSSKPSASSRGYDSRAGSTSRAASSSRTGYSGRGYDSRAGSSSRAYSQQSRSLPNLTDDTLYSEGQSSYFGERRSRSSSRLAKWGVDNEDDRDTLGRPQSRGSKSTLKRSNTFSAGNAPDDTEEAFIKGYTAALREALVTLSSNNEEGFNKKEPAVQNQEEFIEMLLSRASSRNRTESSDKLSRAFSSGSRSRDSRTTSQDTRISNHVQNREGLNSRNASRRNSGMRNISRISGSTSRASEVDEILSSRLSRKISKPDFRPASRPGQILIDEPYDDYRSTSSVPPSKDDFDDFGFSRKSSRESGFRNARSRNSRSSDQSEDILSTFELMSTHGGRPSTRSRMSNRKPSGAGGREFVTPPSMGSDMTYPYSEHEGPNFYNTLNLDGTNTDFAYPDKHVHKEGGQPRNRTSSRGSAGFSNASRSRSASAMGRVEKQMEKPVQWFMGDDEREPIYSSEYGDARNRDSFASGGRGPMQRSLSFSYSDAEARPGQQLRLDSVGSSNRKVTFGSNPNIKEVPDRRTSWN